MGGEPGSQSIQMGVFLIVIVEMMSANREVETRALYILSDSPVFVSLYMRTWMPVNTDSAGCVVLSRMSTKITL